MPHQCAAEGCMSCQTHVLRCLSRIFHLLHRPLAFCFEVTLQFCRGKSVKKLIIRRMDSYQLTLKVSRKLRNLQPGVVNDALNLICIGLAFSGFLKVDKTAHPSWDLYAFVADAFCPLAD